MARILFVGGGTAGHIAPAIAIWEACQSLLPNAEAHFVCSEKESDKEFLTRNNLTFTALNAPRLSLSFPLTFIKALRSALEIIDQEKPDIIVSKGGYVSLPVCLAAKYDGVPIILHESDAVSGYANRIVSFFAQEVCTGFPSKHHHTGNPVRSDIAKGAKQEGLSLTGLKGDRPILLVMGGSQGAKSINECIAKLLPDLLLRCDVIHITGKNKKTVTEPREGYYQIEFAAEELKHLYACSDVAVTRAGAGSLAELAACGIPSIVIPLRGVGHDHQYRNALAAASSQGCIHLEQSEMGKMLLPTVHSLVTDEQIRTKMSERIHSLNTADAALQIAKIIVQTLDSAQRDQ